MAESGKEAEKGASQEPTFLSGHSNAYKSKSNYSHEITDKTRPQQPQR